MLQALGTVLFIIFALVIIAAVGIAALSLLGLIVNLVGMAVKLAIIGGVIYLIWLGVRKLARTA